MRWRTELALLALAIGLCAMAARPASSETPEWMKEVPPARPMPPLGDFPRPPSGPGYYSLMDALTGTRRQEPPKYPFRAYALAPPSMFDVDFRYLDDPANTQVSLSDPLKRIRLGEDWLFSTGGQVWWRHQTEVSSRLTGTNNTFDLLRTSIYADLWYRDRLRAFVQFSDARVFGEDLPRGPLDEDHHDFQNLFVDLKLGRLQEKNVYLRVGRQELLYGSQRLISTLDWANVRRSFQGVKAFRTGEKLDVDLFWVQPVNSLNAHANSIDADHRSDWNWSDTDQNLFGLWTTYRPQKNHFIDGYYLMLDNDNRKSALGIERMPFTIHTLGSRYYGDFNQFLWDVEVMFQTGNQDGNTIIAGSSSVGVGYHFKDLPMNPTLWAYYDFASGDDDPDSGSRTTFNQMFPFGHFYQGWSDVSGRQNIHDIGAYVGFWPTKWLVARLQYHHLMLHSTDDALYNIVGVPYRRDATGDAGRNVGDEVSFILNVHVSSYSDLLAGYAHLFPGRFIRRTGSSDQVGMFYLIHNLHW